MYTAKELQTGVERYDPLSDSNDRSRLTLLTDLRHALAHEELLLHFQPKLNLTDGTLAGVEALVRWQHPTRGLLHPADFLPTVEHTGLIWPLTLTVLDLALTQTSTWRHAGHDLQVAVNLSARCLHRPDLAAQVLQRLQTHDVPARSLRLELTESALMAEPERAL
ncbi:EAL domain-containing protein, partial [Aquipuribacter hungaricus]|uniref:EAL domain-containing protein n=1 Tax=Aquipuribacter hungaricus TaxID=545624 RepID=UPI0030EED209